MDFFCPLLDSFCLPPMSLWIVPLLTPSAFATLRWLMPLSTSESEEPRGRETKGFKNETEGFNHFEVGTSGGGPFVPTFGFFVPTSL